MKHGAHKDKLAHEGTILKDRFTTDDIYERIIQVADEEVETSSRKLFFSAIAAGFAITLTFFLYASMYAATDGHSVLKALLYPLGFVYIVLGGYQLFTENTLPPVALVLERMISVVSMLRVWLIVFIGNIVAGGLGAWVLASSQVFSSEAFAAAISLATATMDLPFAALFVKGAFAGFIVAGVVWLDYAARDSAARFLLIYSAFLCIPLTGLKHVVITSTEMVFLAFTNGTSYLSTFPLVVVPVLLGNILGGVLLVTVVNYFQTPEYLREHPEAKLPVRKWLLGF